MKLRIKIDPALTRDELVARLPDIIGKAAEAVLEKSRSVRADVEGALWQQHPVEVVAAGERDFYEQGRSALAGIHSWLMRALRVEATLRKSTLTKEGYRDEVQEAHGIRLGSTTTFEHAKQIDNVLDLLPKDVLRGVRLISVDGRFGASDRKYPNHGRYYEVDEKVVLNPDIFGEETTYRDGHGARVQKVTHTLLHEIGHAFDDEHGLSDKREWRKISGWVYVGDKEPPEGCERLDVHAEGEPPLVGKWAYKKGTCFPRWYGARNPKEDFCEAFAFYSLGAKEYFKGESGDAKWDFISTCVAHLLKSQSPETDLTASSFDDVLKSQDFTSYFEMRRKNLGDVDELEAVGTTVSEFLSEPCGDLFLEKAEAYKPTPEPKAAAEPKAAHSLGPNPLKGMMKPGHKYIYREEVPGGGFRYYYQMPGGHHYFSHDALHEEGKHLQHAKSSEEWGNYQKNVTAREQMPEVTKEGFEAAGGGAHLFDAPDVDAPKLISDIKPNAKTFDPHAKKEGEEAKPEAERPDWRPNKPAREQEDLLLTTTDAPRIEQVMKTWQIDKVEKFNGGVNLTFRVHMKNDGWAVLKPQAGSTRTYAQHGHMRTDMDEMSTVFREVMAYELDKALGFNLVPPTAYRDMKGVGHELLGEHLKNSLENDPLKKYDSHDMSGASLQFFAEGGMTLEDYEDYLQGKRKYGENINPLEGIAEKELIPMALFDMLINHQDRHLNNIMRAPELDAEGRYGGKYRLVAIDNGYCAGNGGMHNAHNFGDHNAYLGKAVTGKQIPKEMLRKLRKLREDIRDKRRRRKIFSHEVRANVSEDQIGRIAHRIDYLLDPSRRGKKGEVYVPKWRDMAAWEEKKYPPKYDVVPDQRKNPFDITGKTAIVGKEADGVKKFKNAGEAQDFLHPLLAHLNPDQKGRLLDALQDKPRERDLRLRMFINEAPPRLVNQLFRKQQFHARLGMKGMDRANISRLVKDHVDRDFVKEFHDRLKRNNPQAYDKLVRGEMDREGMRQAIGAEEMRKAEARWILPPNMRLANKSKTDRIFDDPGHFGWPAEAPKEGDATQEIKKPQSEPRLFAQKTEEKVKNVAEMPGKRVQKLKVKNPAAKVPGHKVEDFAEFMEKNKAPKEMSTRDKRLMREGVEPGKTAEARLEMAERGLDNTSADSGLRRAHLQRKGFVKMGQPEGKAFTKRAARLLSEGVPVHQVPKAKEIMEQAGLQGTDVSESKRMAMIKKIGLGGGNVRKVGPTTKADIKKKGAAVMGTDYVRNKDTNSLERLGRRQGYIKSQGEPDLVVSLEEEE